MGLLIDGVCHDRWYDTEASGGRSVRSEARFRNRITADGRPSPTGDGSSPAEPGRYHLASRPPARGRTGRRSTASPSGSGTGSTSSVFHGSMGRDGSAFGTGGSPTGEHLCDHRDLRELSLRADPRFTGRVTVPVLWDRERETIVGNRSADIVRRFDRAFDGRRGERIDR